MNLPGALALASAGARRRCAAISGRDEFADGEPEEAERAVINESLHWPAGQVMLE